MTGMEIVELDWRIRIGGMRLADCFAIRLFCVVGSGSVAEWTLRRRGGTRKYYTLNNGVEIPKLGLGTWFIDDADAADAVRAAVATGYRHIDTAQAYGNERGVGEGIRTCGVPREELFVVSKVAAEHKTYEEAKAGIDETLKKMGLDYLDMMIIHSP